MPDARFQLSLPLAVLVAADVITLEQAEACKALLGHMPMPEDMATMASQIRAGLNA